MARAFYSLCTLLGRLILYYLARAHVLGRDHLPLSNAFLLAANHISHFDPPLISCLAPRRIEWIATKELFEGPISKRFLQWIGGIPVDRFHTDGNALRTIILRLRRGAVVGIFPEGGIRSGKNSLLEGASSKLGLATLSVLSGVPIIPCVVLGTDRLYESRYWNPLWKLSGGKRVPLWVVFGEPIQPDLSLPRKEARDRVHSQVTVSIQTLARFLKEHFKLSVEDLPQTAEQRRG